MTSKIVYTGSQTFNSAADGEQFPGPSEPGFPPRVARRDWRLRVARECDGRDSRYRGARSDVCRQCVGLLQEMLGAAKECRIEKDEHDRVSDSRQGERWIAARTARESAAEEIEEQAKPESLVRLRATERQEIAARLLIKNARVGCRRAAMVDEPPFWARLFLLKLSAHLTLGCGARAEIDHDRIA